MISLFDKMSDVQIKKNADDQTFPFFPTFLSTFPQTKVIILAIFDLWWADTFNLNHNKIRLVED